MLNKKNIESFKLFYFYFFPVIFFPFLNIYQYRYEDIQSSLFNNLLISISVLLTPIFVSISMLIIKFLYRDHNREFEYRSLLVGSLCFIFLMLSNYYQFHHFSSATDLNINHYRGALMLSFMAGCLFSNLLFSIKYLKYSKQYKIDNSTKTSKFLAGASLPFAMTITTIFII